MQSQKRQGLAIFSRKDNERRAEVEGAEIREIETDRQNRQRQTIFFKKDNDRRSERERDRQTD